MIIAQNKLLTTSYIKQEKILVSVFKGKVDFDLAMEQTDQILEFYKKNEVKGRIFDITLLYGTFGKMITYYSSAFSKAVDNGLECVAYVISDDILAQNLIKKLEAVALSFEVKAQIFTEFKEAEKWVKSVL